MQSKFPLGAFPEKRLLEKFANHAESCGCFICRTLTDNEREALRQFWHEWAPSKRKVR